MKQLVLLSKEEYEGLKHHGVPGMKWGVRKEPERTGGNGGHRGLSPAAKSLMVGGLAGYAIHKYRTRKSDGKSSSQQKSKPHKPRTSAVKSIKEKWNKIPTEKKVLVAYSLVVGVAAGALAGTSVMADVSSARVQSNLKLSQDYDGLKHHGVPGMKWGVRKERETTGQSRIASLKSKWSSRNQKPPTPREEAVPKKAKPTQMTNAELRRANERLRLENEYKRLLRESTAKPKQDNKSKSAVQKAVDNVVTKIATGVAMYVIGGAINKNFDVNIKF